MNLPHEPGRRWYYPIWLATILVINGTGIALGFAITVPGPWLIGWLVVAISATIGSLAIADITATAITAKFTNRHHARKL